MSSPSNNNSSRKGKGRQKVNMAKIENETNLQVTFSKRRAGLFKKASELSTLCGAETAVVVFSPGNKAHSFGHPNVDIVANRFLNQSVPHMSDAEKLLEAHQKASINQQNLELVQLLKQLELEQNRAQELERVRKEGQCQRWCPPSIDKLESRQLEQLKGALLQFRHKLENKIYNATSFAPLVPGPGPSPRTRGFSHGNRSRGGRPVLGRPTSRVQFDDGSRTSDASARANNSNFLAFDDATIPYDPMAGDSCPTIAYYSRATTPSVDPNEH